MAMTTLEREYDTMQDAQSSMTIRNVDLDHMLYQHYQDLKSHCRHYQEGTLK